MSEESATPLILENEDATRNLAETLASVAETGDVITLSGTLGVGKSAFARAFIEACGANDEEIPSPTFSLVQIYETDDLTLYHFDLYRLEDESEVLELGIEDALYGGVSLIEWPDRLGAYMPIDHLNLELRLGETPGGRIAVLTPHGEEWAERLEGLTLG